MGAIGYFLTARGYLPWFGDDGRLLFAGFAVGVVLSPSMNDSAMEPSLYVIGESR